MPKMDTTWDLILFVAFFCGSFVLFRHWVCHDFASGQCSLVVTCLDRADLLALVCDVKLCSCHFPMWYPESGVVLDCINF